MPYITPRSLAPCVGGSDALERQLENLTSCRKELLDELSSCDCNASTAMGRTCGFALRQSKRVTCGVAIHNGQWRGAIHRALD